MKKSWGIFVLVILVLILAGCKDGRGKNKKKVIEAAENVLHYRNVLGIRDIAMRADLLDDWGDSEIKEAFDEAVFEVAVLDVEPCGEPAVIHLPSGWENLPCKTVFYEELTGAEIGQSLAGLVERSEGEKPWGDVQVVTGHPLEDETVLDSSWVVPFVFVHDQMVAPLAGSGAIFYITVILDSELKLISVITTGGQTWIS